MTQTIFPATKLLSTQRIDLAIAVMAVSVNISRLSSEHHVSRKFVYQQKDKATIALDEAFAARAACTTSIRWLLAAPVLVGVDGFLVVGDFDAALRGLGEIEFPAAQLFHIAWIRAAATPADLTQRGRHKSPTFSRLHEKVRTFE